MMPVLLAQESAFEYVLVTIARVYRLILNLPVPASTVAARIDGLHIVEITFYTLVAVAYFGAALIFLVRYRRRREHDVGANLHGGGIVLGWAFGIFAVFVAFHVVSAAQYRTIRTPPADTYDVYVVAKQWTWKFAPTTGDPSVGVLYVPVGRPVRLLLTSRDVIHSFFVPAFRLKQDAVPGTYSSLWFEATAPGTYDVFCTQLCGVGHARMRAQVVALDPADFERWRAGQAPVVDRGLLGEPSRLPGEPPTGGPESLVETGRQAATTYGCVKCHTLDGQPHIGPTWLGLYGSTVALADGGTVTADPAYITQSMMDPLAHVVRGFQPVMPSYQGLIEPGDTAAIIELMKALSDPRAVDVLKTPSSVEPGPAGGGSGREGGGSR